MTSPLMTLVAAALAVAVLGYLVYTIVRPERF
jgi:K+-transporting ATPase KdpF subunit